MLRTLTSRDLFSVVAIVVLAAFGTVLVSRNLPMVQAGENWLAEPAPTTMQSYSDITDNMLSPKKCPGAFCRALYSARPNHQRYKHGCSDTVYLQ